MEKKFNIDIHGWWKDFQPLELETSFYWKARETFKHRSERHLNGSRISSGTKILLVKVGSCGRADLVSTCETKIKIKNAVTREVVVFYLKRENVRDSRKGRGRRVQGVICIQARQCSGSLGGENECCPGEELTNFPCNFIIK